jgi:hypothetical protein
MGAASLGILLKTPSDAENPASGKPVPAAGDGLHIPCGKRTGAESAT